MARRSVGLVYPSCVKSHFKTCLIWILTYSCKRALRLLLWLLWIPKSPPAVMMATFNASHVRISVSVLQVMWKSVSGSASHMRCVWMCNEIEGSYDKIIIAIVPSYTRKISLACCRWHLLVVCTRNNTDGNKLVIFFSIASYYGDNYCRAWAP